MKQFFEKVYFEKNQQATKTCKQNVKIMLQIYFAGKRKVYAKEVVAQLLASNQTKIFIAWNCKQFFRLSRHSFLLSLFVCTRSEDPGKTATMSCCLILRCLRMR